MKRTLVAFAVVAAVAAAALAALPVSARVAPASDLQIVASGHEGLAAGKPGCTRVTNRFCVQSTQSNCFACR